MTSNTFTKGGLAHENSPPKKTEEEEVLKILIKKLHDIAALRRKRLGVNTNNLGTCVTVKFVIKTV